MKSFIVITIVVLITGILLYLIIKEFIKTYKNKPYNPDHDSDFNHKDRLL
ncbi:MAG: hypothetical protein WCS10_02810 [Bacteroidales bacterium]|jgi:hypothetical protein|nr:hypothetical protein [Bacteroidales bacterium]MDD4002072.1 hypothetical protein [Bacteroidales bacterium]MDD4528793.1 hypothetical protein [Bacteroidales bacterium]MDD4830073.1 hypothetical protein [Bacteroidales bacterium]